MGFDITLDKALPQGGTDYDNEYVVAQTQAYLHTVEDLQYDYHVIQRFYTALKTNQLIILCGPPGTGKTSLVRGFANAIEAKAVIVSVQPSWTDNQDILGFYNPNDKRYVSTPFLDTLIEAANTPHILYLICLDEMNLAHLEYYFAEILSKMESTKVLDLYSTRNVINVKRRFDALCKKYKASSVEELKAVIKAAGEDIEAVLQYEDSCVYPAQLTIPPNVRFIGTVNIDETTKTLSPKVVDRSFVIELKNVKLKQHQDVLTPPVNYDNVPLKLSPSMFKQSEKELDPSVWQWIESNQDTLFELGVELNKRFERQLKEYYNGWTGSAIVFWDHIIAGKILPKISRPFEDENDGQAILTAARSLALQLAEMKLSKAKLDSMLSNAETQLTFWGR